MLQNLLTLLVLGLVLFLIYTVAGMFVHGTVLLIIGAILAILFVLKAVKLFGLDL